MAPAEYPHFYPSGQHDRDERGSISDSDDGNYAPYADPLKVETDTEGTPLGTPLRSNILTNRKKNADESTTLTSQTLNADGTPKRPMNAFMIFARRRRPQVSAENQAMRTGEISKILSKEWNAMQPVSLYFIYPRICLSLWRAVTDRETVLPRPSQTAQRFLQQQISGLRLPTSTEQFSQTPETGRAWWSRSD